MTGLLGASRPRSSPRAWGCFLPASALSLFAGVFPTCVGVFPLYACSLTVAKGLPHVRGGVSYRGDRPVTDYEVFPTCVGVFLHCLGRFRRFFRSSPRAWGCFLVLREGADVGAVFPTCVGVFPMPSVCPTAPMSLPHVRGGVSYSSSAPLAPLSSSPRAWGCFPFVRHEIREGPVFPTCVGVFLLDQRTGTHPYRLPHVRGGVSKADVEEAEPTESSPRACGCFSGYSVRTKWSAVFPTCVGVFLYHLPVLGFVLRLPHVRGGVSLPYFVALDGELVFPTCVGVFLLWKGTPAPQSCLPHVRGGVSRTIFRRRHAPLSSPRAWGCF